MKKLAKDAKKMSMLFTMVETQLQSMKKAASNMYEYEDEDKASHFHMDKINVGKSKFQFAQLDKKFEPCIASLFNQTADHNAIIKTNLDLRGDVLLDSQSTMDLFCNRGLSEKKTNSKAKMQLKRNCGTMTVSHQATVNGYHNSVWFSENLTTNIIVISNLRLRYLVTYRSDEMMFTVHR